MKEILLQIIDDIREGIMKNDSFEGSLSYSCMIEEIPCGRDEFEVSAMYRTGNQDRQGCCRIIRATPIPLPVDE